MSLADRELVGHRAKDARVSAPVSCSASRYEPDIDLHVLPLSAERTTHLVDMLVTKV